MKKIRKLAAVLVALTLLGHNRQSATYQSAQPHSLGERGSNACASRGR